MHRSVLPKPLAETGAIATCPAWPRHSQRSQARHARVAPQLVQSSIVRGCASRWNRQAGVCRLARLLGVPNSPSGHGSSWVGDGSLGGVVGSSQQFFYRRIKMEGERP